MIKKTITYTDFDDVEHTEDYYFHLTKGDLVDWTTEGDGDLVDKLTKIAKTDDPLKIVPVMKSIILRSYGVKSPDGKSFIKDPEVVKNFQYTEAFSEIYIELSTDADKAVEFITGILPKFDADTQKQIDEARKNYEKEVLEAQAD